MNILDQDIKYLPGVGPNRKKMLSNELGIETASTVKNSAAYIQNWLTALRNDKRMIVSAASRADKAVRLILNIDKAETLPDAEAVSDGPLAA